MGLVTVSGEPACRHEELARLAAQRLRFDLVTQGRLESMLKEEFQSAAAIPVNAWSHAATFVLSRLAARAHLVISAPGAEMLFPGYTNMVRIHVVAPESARVGSLMLDRHLDREAGKLLLHQLEKDLRLDRKRRFGRTSIPATTLDLVLNSGSLDPDQMTRVLEEAVAAKCLVAQGLLSAGAEAQIQFQVRLQLAKHGITPSGKAGLKRVSFGHPSEEIFANLLDFYRIAWEYEPRSFPIQWDPDGKVLEAFTPDFYLPEFDLYVELTTMKQSLVNRKNRKVKLLRSIYPGVNIQVFYQKDFQDLVFKYGLADRTAKK